MPGSNKAVGTGVLQGVTAHVPLFSIPPGSPPRPSDSFSGQLQSTRKPAPPATPIIGFQKQLSVQLVSAGQLCRHACLSLSALKSLIRRLEIVTNSQQVPLAPLTKSGTCTWSALPIPPVLHQLRRTWWDVWFLWRAKGNFSFIRPRGKEQRQKHFTPCLHFSKNY